MKKVCRTQNPSDVLTHAPSANELRVFLPMMGTSFDHCKDDCITKVSPMKGGSSAALVGLTLLGQLGSTMAAADTQVALYDGDQYSMIELPRTYTSVVYDSCA